jgi:hypothetical protein
MTVAMPFFMMMVKKPTEYVLLLARTPGAGFPGTMVRLGPQGIGCRFGGHGDRAGPVERGFLFLSGWGQVKVPIGKAWASLLARPCFLVRAGHIGRRQARPSRRKRHGTIRTHGNGTRAKRTWHGHGKRRTPHRPWHRAHHHGTSWPHGTHRTHGARSRTKERRRRHPGVHAGRHTLGKRRHTRLHPWRHPLGIGGHHPRGKRRRHPRRIRPRHGPGRHIEGLLAASVRDKTSPNKGYQTNHDDWCSSSHRSLLLQIQRC